MEQMLGLLWKQFFWPKMCVDVRAYIRQCRSCTYFKQPQERAKLQPILATYPLELVCLHFLTLGGRDHDNNVLLVMDHFTKYAQAYITKSQTAAVVARTFWVHFLVHYGWPSKILRDQGKNFESKVVQELCDLTQAQMLCTTPYRPKTNGACERLNLTLINMLGTPPQPCQEQLAGLGNHYDSCIQLYIVFCFWDSVCTFLCLGDIPFFQQTLTLGSLALA